MKTQIATYIDTTETTETYAEGPHGHGAIKRLPSGARILEFTPAGDEQSPLRIPSQRLHLMSRSIEEALNQACHSGTPIETFKLTEIKGPKALVCLYEAPTPTQEGSYATIIKTGVKPLKFAVSRIDLKAMQSLSIVEALRKVAFSTGSVKLAS